MKWGFNKKNSYVVVVGIIQNDAIFRARNDGNSIVFFFCIHASKEHARLLGAHVCGKSQHSQ